MGLSQSSCVTKGKDAERKICTDMNTILNVQLMRYGMRIPGTPTFQRRQNQSAVGGSDIENPFDLSIEVKAQEVLNVNTWWKQCVTSAEKDGGLPILLYKQNNKGYKCMMYAELFISSNKRMWLPVTLSFEAFEQWLGEYLSVRLDAGWIPKG